VVHLTGNGNLFVTDTVMLPQLPGILKELFTVSSKNFCLFSQQISSRYFNILLHIFFILLNIRLLRGRVLRLSLVKYDTVLSGG